GRAEEYGADTL
nr:Chain C, 11MER PEPTIDE [Gallus gallus]